MTSWLVVLFTKLGAQGEEGAENNEFHSWQTVFDLSWPCAVASGGLYTGMPYPYIHSSTPNYKKPLQP